MSAICLSLSFDNFLFAAPQNGPVKPSAATQQANPVRVVRMNAPAARLASQSVSPAISENSSNNSGSPANIKKLPAPSVRNPSLTVPNEPATSQASMRYFGLDEPATLDLSQGDPNRSEPQNANRRWPTNGIEDRQATSAPQQPSVFVSQPPNVPANVPMVDMVREDEAWKTEAEQTYLGSGKDNALLPHSSAPENQPAPSSPEAPPLPRVSQAWWQNQIKQPLLTNNPDRACVADLDQLILLSMQYSPRVQSILVVPKIQRADINIALGAFDPRGYAQSLYHNTSDPVGNTLTTGGPRRLEETFWENSVGARHTNMYGGKAEWSQTINARDNNSVFFKPSQQADTKLVLSYTQPLMRGAGRDYNTAAIRIAGVKTQASIASANMDLQNHTLDITQAYWDLVSNRYLLVQSSAAIKRLTAIKEQIENRRGIDSLNTHFNRAVAAIAIQTSQVATARANIKSAQEKLRRLVYSPDLLDNYCEELIPMTMPADEMILIDVESEFKDAMQFRGDVLAIQNEIHQLIIEKKVAANDLKPTLNYIQEFYVHGLQGNYNEGRAWVNQFDQGRPSASVGFSYQRPAFNRTALGTLTAKSREQERLQYDYADRLAQARERIISAAEKSYGAFISVQAAEASTISSWEEVEENKAKFFKQFDDQSKSSILYELLDAENRFIAAENSWANRLAILMQSLAQVKFESGTLMAIRADATNLPVPK